MSLQQDACRPVSSFFQEGIAARLRLAKAPLCLLLSFSTLFGCVLATPRISSVLLPLVIGVLLLSGGAATLNSLQEWRQDSLMVRTRNRPLPRGDLSLRQAAWQAALLISLGMLFLSFLATLLPLATGLLALLLYNGIYTPLKQKTALAVLPGALCGGLPPLIGWFAGGGQLFSPAALLLVLLLVLWQIPHYWLIVLRYRGDYYPSRVPGILNSLTEKRLGRLLIPWVGSLAAAMLLFAILSPGLENPTRWLVILTSGLLFAVFVGQLLLRPQRGYRMLFIILNLIFFFNMLVIFGARISLMSALGE